MLKQFIWDVSGRVKTTPHCFFRWLGETLSHMTENLGETSSPHDSRRGFHRRNSEGDAKFGIFTQSQPLQERSHSGPLRLPPVFQFHTEQTQHTPQLKPFKMASTHQSPAIGSPAWIRIPATDVPRAQKFYEEVFGWKFHDQSSAGYVPSKLAVFSIPGAPTLMVSLAL